MDFIALKAPIFDYSFLRDASRFFQQELDENDFSSNESVAPVSRDILVQRAQ